MLPALGPGCWLVAPRSPGERLVRTGEITSQGAVRVQSEDHYRAA